MPTVRRLIAAIFFLALVFSAAVPVMAQEEETTDTTVAGEEGTTATTVAEEGATDNADVAPPAVTVPVTAADDAPADWTYRYLIPTLLALAAIVVLVTTIQYFVRVVRNRYKVVE